MLEGLVPEDLNTLVEQSNELLVDGVLFARRQGPTLGVDRLVELLVLELEGAVLALLFLADVVDHVVEHLHGLESVFHLLGHLVDVTAKF